MRQSIGMNTQLNIIIIFILIVFALTAASLSYYKAFKVNNAIVNSIEKYEGFNAKSQSEIEKNLKTLGYQQGVKNCKSDYSSSKTIKKTTYGYCVEYVSNLSKGTYSYKVTTYMTIDLPIINIIKIPIKTSTDNIPCLGNNTCK